MMGITSPLHGYCAETLGGLSNGVSPLEMADAYATIASGGYRNRPRIIRKVSFPDGKSDLPARWRVKRTKVFSDGVTYEATKILQDNVNGGTGTHAQIGCPQGGKTGTTDHNTDAWFVGFTPRMSTAVWVGYPDSRVEMNGLYFGRNVDGGTYPADIWGAYMKQAVGKFCGPFPKPKEPFQSQPFFGHYATTGRQKLQDEQPAGPERHADGLPDPGHGRHRQPATAGSTRTSTRPRRSPRRPPAGRPRRRPPRRHDRPHRRASGGHGHTRVTAGLGRRPPGWYNLRRWAAPVRGGDGGMREGSAAAPLRMRYLRECCYGDWCREVVQRREGLRLHHPG